MDALAIVALWARIATPPYSFAEIRRALERPGYVLYLGRKSCPLGLPLEGQLVTAASVREASRRLLGDTAAVTALLDRLLHHAHILTCGPRSWRTRLHSDSAVSAAR